MNVKQNQARRSGKVYFQKVANKIHHEVLTTQQEKWQTKNHDLS
jgi:hypothetical protein